MHNNNKNIPETMKLVVACDSIVMMKSRKNTEKVFKTMGIMKNVIKKKLITKNSQWTMM